MLVNKRLDLDIAKTRLRKAHEAEAEARVRGPQLVWVHIYLICGCHWFFGDISFLLLLLSVMHLLRPVRTWTQTRWAMTTFPMSPSCSVSSVLNGLRYVSLALVQTKIHTYKYIGVHWNKWWLKRGIFPFEYFLVKTFILLLIYSTTKILLNTVHIAYFYKWPSVVGAKPYKIL